MRPAIVSNPSISDAALVHQIAKGDLHALGMLFDRYEQEVRRFLARMQVPSGDLDDLVQVTFLEVVRPAQRFDATRDVRPWLFGLAAISVKRHRRTLGRVARKLAAWAREPMTSRQKSPAELAEETDSARRAALALQTLSAKKRDVFVMVVMENLSGEATARALGIPVATVWTRLHHARRELQGMLREDAR